MKPGVNLLFVGATSFLVFPQPRAAREQAANKAVTFPKSVPGAAGEHRALHGQRMSSAFGWHMEESSWSEKLFRPAALFSPGQRAACMLWKGVKR